MKKTISTCAKIFPALLMVVLLLAANGCQTGEPKTRPAAPHSEALILREGDVLKITFPGSPNLDTGQTIRRDGKITLQLAGEITATGMTPSDLEKEIAKAYGSQLISKEVTVTVLASSIPVFVTGAVLSPHKVVSDHPITALEAIMEAGGPDYAKANMKIVRVIRYENGRAHTYILNLKEVLGGKQVDPFYMQPFDIIYVPERFSMF
jgi:polysaccharide export outer membrane protein